MSNTPEQAAARAIAILGGPRKVSVRYDISVQAVYKWSKIPVDRVLEIEKATGAQVTRYEMRPDIYGQSAEEDSHQSWG